MWMTSCLEAMGWGFWVVFEKSRELRFESGRSEMRSEPRRVQLGLRDAPRVVGSDWTVSIVEILCVSLSLLVSKNLKVKMVIKVSYLNYRESSVFRVSSDFYVYEHFKYPYICTVLSWLYNTIIFLVYYENSHNVCVYIRTYGCNLVI